MAKMLNNDYQRLFDLKQKINLNIASKDEKNEYMLLLYRNGSITKQQYDAYISNQNADELIKGALTIGGILLATWLIAKLFEKS